MDKSEARPATMTVQEVFDRALAHQRAGRMEEAERHYRLCLAHRPDSATAWTNLGVIMRATRRFEAAIACHRKAIEADPRLVNAHANLSNALCDTGSYDEAAAIRERLLAADPDNWARIRDLAIAYRGCWRNAEVIRLVDSAQERLGPDEDARLQRSLAHLMLGNYREGFADFEARYAGDEVSLPKDAPWPRWQGEPLDGRSLVVLPEQGFGDAVLMARFMPRLKALGGHISLVVKPPLQRLLAGIEGMDAMLDAARRAAHFDYYTTNMSLPHRVGMPADGPPPMPRLTIPEDARERARAIVAPFANRFRIGVVWTGSLEYRANHRRSTGPESFLGLAAVPGVQLFSLYKGPAHGDFLTSGAAGPIVDACGADRDFADTAALIDEMDLMITTDTAVVHVAGSLGKPIWNLLPPEGFWLYGGADTTPWYPSMRLFRVPRDNDWRAVFDRVEREVRMMLERRR